MASTRWIRAAFSGWRSEANAYSEWIAASRALRVRALLPRSCRRWSRNADQRRVQVCQIQCGGLLGQPLVSEREQQAHRVAVGGYGVRAGMELPSQPFGEERLQGRCERAHHSTTDPMRGSRSATRCISSGVADRYQ